MIITFKKIGDFYEAYGDEARAVGTALTMTVCRGRNSGDNSGVAMVGIPYHAIGRSIAALESNGYIVQVLA